MGKRGFTKAACLERERRTQRETHMEREREREAERGQRGEMLDERDVVGGHVERGAHRLYEISLILQGEGGEIETC